MRTKRKKDKTVSRTVRRRRFLCLALIGLSVFFAYSIVVLRVRISRERQEEITVEQQTKDMALMVEELERIVYNDGKDEYVERMAREKLGYAAIDERVFVDLAGS